MAASAWIYNREGELIYTGGDDYRRVLEAAFAYVRDRDESVTIKWGARHGSREEKITPGYLKQEDERRIREMKRRKNSAKRARKRRNPGAKWHLEEARSWQKAYLAADDLAQALWTTGNQYAHGLSAQESPHSRKERDEAVQMTGKAFRAGHAAAKTVRALLPKKNPRKRRKNSTVRVPLSFAANPARRSSTFKVGDIVTPRWYVQGYPTGLSVDTRAVVREIVKRDKRMRVERDDGRQGSWWLSFDAVRRWGENPRRHVPKLPRRGRPVRVRTFKFKLYDRKGTHLGTKAEKTAYDKAKALANRMKRGTFRGRKIAKIVMEW